MSTRITRKALIEKIITERLMQTLKCEFKKTVVQHLLGDGWSAVHIKTFSAESAEIIDKSLEGK